MFEKGRPKHRSKSDLFLYFHAQISQNAPELLQSVKNPFVVQSVDISQGLTRKSFGSTTNHHEHQAGRTQEVNNTQRLAREKRPYRRVTNGQRLEIANLFRHHGDDKPAEWYSHEVGIRLARTRDLLTLLRNGKSVMPKGHYRRRSRVEPFERLTARCLNKRPTISTRRDDGRVRAEHARGALFCDEGEERGQPRRPRGPSTHRRGNSRPSPSRRSSRST